MRSPRHVFERRRVIREHRRGGGSLAEQAYAAYGDEVGWVSHTGLPMPSWEDLPDKQKNGWHQAVALVVEKVL